jgi:exonuclease III
MSTKTEYWFFIRQKPKSHPRTRPVNTKPKNVVKHQQHYLLNLAAFNIKGFQSNQNYYNELIQKFDILLLQEHWLFNFEQEILKQYHIDFTAFTRHVDDFDPISPISRPRGYGGIAVVYKKTLSPSITQLPDGDNRIQSIEIIINDKSICLVNVLTCKRIYNRTRTI